MQPLAERKQKILCSLIAEHIKSHDTVSSKMLSQSFGLSSATMRNEMGELERSGYIFQPHTSAGRVPTEEGYRFYVKHHIANAKIGRRESQAIASLLDQEINPRRVARLLAQLTEQT